MFGWIYNTFNNIIYDVINYVNIGLNNINLTTLINLDAMIIAFDIGKRMINRECKYNKIIDRYNNIYRLNWIMRILMYYLIYNIFNVFKNIYFINFMNISLIIFVIPKIQNAIVQVKNIEYLCIKIKHEILMIIRYIISKNIINYCRKLFSLKISNHNIFLLMNTLNYEWIKNMFQNLCFIGFMMLLRSYEITYYYYKGIKISYYYKTGYLIEVIERNEAIEIIKKIIEDKEWNKLSEIENVTPLYHIIFKDYNRISLIESINYFFIKFFIIWSWIEWLFIKLNNEMIINFILCVSGFFINNYAQLPLIICSVFNNKNVTYTFPSLLITIYIVLRNYIYVILMDSYFYIKNYNSIIEILDYYKH